MGSPGLGIRGGNRLSKDSGCSAVPPKYFPPIMDWEVQCERRENGLKCCGGFLKCCVTTDPAEGEPDGEVRGHHFT